MIPAVFFFCIYKSNRFLLCLDILSLLSKRREDNPSWSRLPSHERGR